MQLLSELTTFGKYARYRADKLRRELWPEIVQRIAEMHMRKYPKYALEIEEAFDFVHDKLTMPSMRSAQFAGRPIEISQSRIYNCAYAAMSDPAAFQEAMFLLLGGTGFGYSVQKQHVDKLPAVQGPSRRKRKHVIGDSIEGWADAIKVLTKAYFQGKSTPVFDYSDIRPKGSDLVTSGGKAPGPQPLKDCIHNLIKVLDGATGRKLRPIEVHDMLCYMADAVLAGGIRRAAMISLFSRDDIEMICAKSGAWWEQNAQRGRANNSAVLIRGQVTQEEFYELFTRIKASGSGEPGVYWTNDPDYGTNPCCEISLKDMGFCNLTTINAEAVTDQASLEAAAEAATIIGTLQAAYTDFHYLREEWRQNAEDEALLGVSITGIASGRLEELDLRAAVDVARRTNAEWAEKLGINPAKRITCIKPEGTSSLVCGTSSGIHAWHAPYYIRRLRFGRDEAIAQALMSQAPGLMVDDVSNPAQVILEFPVKSPQGVAFRDEPAADLLARIAKYSKEWVKPGHISGPNTHNVSATVSIREDEWDYVCDWMWSNRDLYNGISILPHSDHTYTQAPFEDIDEDEYKRRVALVPETFEYPAEYRDDTTLQAEIACGGGGCEI